MVISKLHYLKTKIYSSYISEKRIAAKPQNGAFLLKTFQHCFCYALVIVKVFSLCEKIIQKMLSKFDLIRFRTPMLTGRGNCIEFSWIAGIVKRTEVWDMWFQATPSSLKNLTLSFHIEYFYRADIISS